MNLYAYVYTDPMGMCGPAAPICWAVGRELLKQGAKRYVQRRAARELAERAAPLANESSDSTSDAGDTPEEWDNVVWGDRDADGPYNPIEPGDPGNENGDDNDKKNDNNQSNKRKDNSYNKGAEHTKGARSSTRSKHQEGDSRRQRDQGREKGDERRPYRR